MLIWWVAVAHAGPWDVVSSHDTLQATFTQTQHRQVFARPLTSSGTVAFSRPGQLRWELQQPTSSLFILDGDQVHMSYPELSVKESFSLGERPELLSVVRSVTVGLQGSLEEARTSYEVTHDDRQATLIPRSPELLRWVSRIELQLSDDGQHLASVTLTEPDGDRVEIAFSGVVVNPTLDAALFHLP
ncbi:MAG: outer membrane lipoprotein carrier protein LolA [Myxococcales bacterium]|nr:outer membrane lipoprotein carrier protein LolA [Myxococcales bacterium]